MKVAILGYGVEGQSAFKHWQAKGADITICDGNSNLVGPPGIPTQLGPDYLKNLGRFDVIMRTQSIRPSLILSQSPGVDTKITTIVNEFLAETPTRNLIGVTGTKGKGTTTTLIAKMLEAAGKHVAIGGNIGIGLLDLLPQLTPNSWVVLELSSTQLIDLQQRSPHIGVCLMIVPEHLNWHADMAEYVQAKSQLFAHQQPGDIAVYLADNDNSRQAAAASPGRKIPFFTPPGAHVEDGAIVIDGRVICATGELKLLGAHNWQNVCAAVTAVWQVTQDVVALRSVLTTFTGLEHRLEFVREVAGVKYYDDSFGTTPETATVAIQAFTQPKIIILGGSDKGAGFDDLAQVAAKSNVRQVVLIGNTTNTANPTITPKVEAALRAAGVEAITSLVKPGGPAMAEVVAAAKSAARPGDVVLLSAACASFDMFKDYKDRGDQFKAAVTAL